MRNVIIMCCFAALALCIGCGSAPKPKGRTGVSHEEIERRADKATNELDTVVK